MNEARHDPVVRRFAPDRELVARAQRAMMADEDNDPVQRYIRQQWEAAFGATRVALDALRSIWPTERLSLSKDDSASLSHAIEDIEAAYTHLDDLTKGMVGEVVADVHRGLILTHHDLDDRLDGSE